MTNMKRNELSATYGAGAISPAAATSDAASAHAALIAALAEVHVWIQHLPVPTSGAGSAMWKVRAVRNALAAAPVATQADQATALQWRGIKAVLTNLIAASSARISDKDDEDDQLIADAEEAVRQLEARFNILPSSGAAREVQAERQTAGDAGAEQAAREIAAIWDSAKAETAMYVEAHCVDGEVHAKHIMEQPRPKITPALPKTGIAAADVTRAQRDLMHYATSADTELAAACARAQVVIERLLSGLDVEQLS